MTRAGRARDNARGAADDAIAEEAVDHLAGAIEVQRAAVEREVVESTEDIGEAGAGLQRAIIEHILPVHGTVRDAGKSVERSRRGGERQGACAGLDDGHGAVADALAAVDRRGDREITNRPQIERREGIGLIDQATGDRRDAAGAHQDATRAEVEDNAVVERKIGVARDGQRVRGDVRRRGGRTGRELDVVVRRDRVDGRILISSQWTEDGGGERRSVAGREGSATASLRSVDQGPWQDTLGAGTVGSALSVEQETIRGTGIRDRGDSVASGLAKVGAAEEHRGAGRSGAVILSSRETGALRRSGEHEVRLLAGLRGDGDNREAATEARDGEGLERRAVGVTDDVQLAAYEIDVRGRAEAVVERCRSGIEHLEDGTGAERVGLRRGGKDADSAEGDLAGVDDDAGVGAELGRLRGGDVQRAGAVLDELVGAQADRAGQVDRAGDREDDLAVAGVVDAPGKREGGAGQGADQAVEGHGHRAGEGIATGDAEDLAVAVQAAAVDFVADIADHDRVGDGDVARELQRRADGGVDDDLVRGEAGGRGIGQTHRAGVDDDAAGGDGPVRGRVGGRELEHAVVILIKQGRGRSERERAVQRQNLTSEDFERVVRLIEDERAAGREGVGRAEARAGRTIDIDGHRIAGVAQGGVGARGEDAREDVERTADCTEGVSAGELERTRARLDQAVVVHAVIDDTREDEALLEIGSRGVGDGEVHRTGERGRPRELQAVAGEVGHAHNLTRDSQVDLTEDLIAGERRGAGAIDGDGGVAGQREVAAQGDVLESATGVTVRREDETTYGLQRARVVADDERAEAALVDDVGSQRRCGVRDRERHLRRDNLDVPGRRQGRDAIERQVVDAGEDMRADTRTVGAEGDIVADREGAGGTQAGAGGHRQPAKAKRTGEDRARGRRAVRADEEGAGRDVDAAGEGAETTQLQHAVTRLGDTAVLDDGIDDQAWLPRSEVLAVDKCRADRDREGSGAIEVKITRAEGRGRGGVDVHRRGVEAGRQGQRAGRDERRRGAAVIVEGQRGQRVGARERDARATADRGRLRRDDAAGELDEGGAVEVDTAGAEATRGPELLEAGLHDRAAGIGIESAELEARGARLTVTRREDQAERNARLVVGDDSVEGHVTRVRAEGAMEDVEVGGLADDAGGEGAVLEDGVGIAVVGAEEETAALKAQREAAEVQRADRRVIAAGDVERVGRDVGKQRVGRRGTDAELDVIRARGAAPQATAGVAREALVTEAADAIGAIGSPLAINDGPRTDDVVRVRQTRRDDEVIAAQLAEVAQVIEPKRGAGTDGTREARHREHGRADVVVRPVRVDLIEARSQGDGAEGLGVIDDRARLELDIRGIKRNRGGIVDAVGHEGVGPVEEVERTLVDRDRRRRREAAGILKVEPASGDEGGAGIVVDALEVPVPRAGLVDEDVTSDRAAEARVRGGGDRRLIGRGVADRAAEEFGLAAAVGAVKRGDELSAAVQVERGASVDREVVAREQRVGGVGHQVDRAAVDHERPLRELLAIEVQRAGQGLVERVRAHESAVDLERLA